MNNISKKSLILFLAIFTILSIAFVNISNAEGTINGTYKNEYSGYSVYEYKNTMRGRLVIESNAEHSYEEGNYITLQDLYDFYDVLCCQKGTAMTGENNVSTLTGINGDAIHISSDIVGHLTKNDEGVKTLFEEDNYSPFGSATYTNKTFGFYNVASTEIATPKEAYILSEMIKELDSRVIYYEVDLDDNGNRVVYNGSLEGSESIVVGDEVLYIIEKQYVVALPDGDLVYAEAVDDGNGGTIYKYKAGVYKNGFMKYEGSLKWEDSKLGSGGMYPSFNASYSSSAESSGVVTNGNVIPSGSQIYVVGSNVVVYDEQTEQYYRASLNSNDSYIQLAWWTTVAGSTGNAIYSTPFAEEAEAFEAYILQAAGVTQTSELKHKKATYEDENGIEKTVDHAFDFEYTADWVSDGEYKNPTVSWDENSQSYLIGPFAIDYIGGIVQFGGRPEVEFAGITGMDIYTDASDNVLEFGKDWNFVYLDGERTDSKDPVYPKSNEKFYIRLNHIENATKITNIKTYFKYMNAAGSYQKLRGTYFKATWEQQVKNFYKYEYQRDENGNPIVDEKGNYKTEQKLDYRKYWLLLINLESIPSQRLALGLNGAKWYEYTEIDRKIDINSGKVVVQKKLVNDQGEEIKNPDSNKFFEFKVTVDGAINSKTETVRVKAGDSVESQVYYWIGNDAPTYKVEEIPQNGYSIVSIDNATGTLKNDNAETSTVIAKNKIADPKEGKIEIVKKIEKSSLDSSKYSLDGKTFNFNLTIMGTFEYNGTVYKNTSMTIHNIPVVAGGSSWVSDSIKWYGISPGFKVVELKQEGSKLLSITPNVGFVMPGRTVTVTATNIQEKEKAAIRIIKTLDGSSNLSKEYINSLEFTFDIQVDGYEKEQIKLKTPTRKDDRGNWVWEGVSSEYVWLYGNNPNYTITEVNVPEGTEYVQGNTTGNLVCDENQNYEVKNEFINKVNGSNTGKIDITKKVEDANLLDKDYKFVVVVSGDNFKYKDFECINGVIEKDGKTGNALQLTNDSAIVIDTNGGYDNQNFVVIKAASKRTDDGKTVGEGNWLSGDFTWYGENAPKYKVEENLLGEDINYSVEPSQGTLINAETIKVTAWNRANSDKAGYLKIIKKLEGADKVSKEYVQSLVFTFEVEVDGYSKSVITLDKDNGLRLDEANNCWIWEYTSDRYSWKAGEEAPHYKVTETKLPDGTEFGSIENGEGQLKESVSQEVLLTTDCTVINKLKAKEGSLTIDKKVTVDSLVGKEFKFKVTLKGTFEYNGKLYTNTEVAIYDENNPLKVKGGEKVTIGTIKWYGTTAPTYTVEELESDIANNISIVNGSGTIKEGTEATIATFTNEPKLVGGKLSIKKILTNYEGPTDEDFYFEVKIGDNAPYIVSIKAGQTYVSDMYKWYITDEAPKYTVKEINIPNGVTLVGIKNSEGSLVANETVATEVIAENKYDEHKATFNIKKVVLDEKLIDAAQEQEFSMKVRITGKYFDILDDDNGAIINGSYVMNIKLKGGQNFTSPQIKWWGNEAPTVTVEEYDIPFGWQNVGISNNGSPILDDSSLEIVVTNKLPVYVTLDLTTKLAGQVWEDKPLDQDGKNTPDSVPNGFIDESEEAVSGVEVYIYKVISDNSGNIVDRELAKVYKSVDNTEVTLPITTLDDGTWEAPRVKIPTVTNEQKQNGYKASYDVEFVYDGQTYEPTKFLATSDGNASTYMNAKTAEKDKFARDSMALDYDRDEVNNRIQTVEGNTPIDGTGKTTGTAVGANGENNLYYELDPSALNEGSKALSTLVTTDNDGTALDLFKTKARTSIGGLTFPYYRDIENWNGFHLYNENTSITELGIEQKYWYEAVYNYCLHINLGLIRRPEADLGLSKDLYLAKVAVKGNEDNIEYNTYRFNTLADINADYYTRQIESQAVASYELGLYSTDYYYRAEMYLSDVNSDLYDKIVNMNKTIPGNVNGEMEVELKYRIVVYNESGSYIEAIKGIDDYYDSSFGEPLSIELNGQNINSYRVEEKGILGSDGTTYNKLVIDNLDVRLASGEMAEFFVTFKVQKETSNGVRDTIIKGQKSNIAEISSYSTYYKDGRVAGKVDKDSAPGNLNIRNHNEKSWYEDDTSSAPVLNLVVKDAARTVNGTVWEDRTIESDSGEAIGNGIRDDKEALIGGLTTELVEKVTVDGIDYDFIWPTSESLNCLGGKSMKDLTGFDSVLETSRGLPDGNGGITGVGTYQFVGVPSGNYVVRFLYGNDKKDLDNTIITYGDPVALTSEGLPYSENNNILTANYDGDKEGMTPAVYNGQDYKATIYQAGDENINSDAIDSEARRLEIIANSETITNSNANVLATANDVNASHRDLYRDYYMYADTAKLDFKLADARNNVTNISNIDCGLIERPETAIVLDKEISSIKLTTNDQRVIFNAMYDISYDLVDEPILGELKDKVIIAKYGNKYLVANIELKETSVGTDVLQAIDKNENKLTSERESNKGIQNFRFINVDDEILQGTTIEINYLMTALNVSDVDYTSKILDDLSGKATVKEDLLNLAKEARQKSAKNELQMGEYLGSYYYTGNVGTNDTVVTTRVRQLVDYVDVNAIFTPMNNMSENNIWKNTNVTELSGNGYEENRLLDRSVLPEYDLLDKNGVLYTNDQRNNIILSVDSLEEGIGNSGFEIKLVPYSNDNEAYKSQITLTVTKTVSAGEDANNLTYDNIAEIVKLENTVGRRDIVSTPGNANPKLGEFTVSLNERDTSATELVTFVPPTGIETQSVMIVQILIAIVIALSIIAVGIVVIKKKVL